MNQKIYQVKIKINNFNNSNNINKSKIIKQNKVAALQALRSIISRIKHMIKTKNKFYNIVQISQGYLINARSTNVLKIALQAQIREIKKNI